MKKLFMLMLLSATAAFGAAGSQMSVQEALTIAQNPAQATEDQLNQALSSLHAEQRYTAKPKTLMERVIDLQSDALLDELHKRKQNK